MLSRFGSGTAALLLALWTRSTGCCNHPPKGANIPEWLREHPACIATSWHRWSKAGRVDVLAAAKELLMQDGIGMLRRGELGSSKAMDGINGTSDPAELLKHIISLKCTSGRTPLIAAVRADKADVCS